MTTYEPCLSCRAEWSVPVVSGNETRRERVHVAGCLGDGPAADRAPTDTLEAVSAEIVRRFDAVWGQPYRAVGHVDYMSKLALYVAQFVLLPAGSQ